MKWFFMVDLKCNQTVSNNKSKATLAPLKDNSTTNVEAPMIDFLKSNRLKIFQQNVCGLSRKTNELIVSLLPNLPQILCLTEHHLRSEEIVNMTLDMYSLGSQFCRKTFKQGGVCIYTSKDMQFSPINLDQFTKEKDFEICALQLCLPVNSVIIMCCYRSPIKNFNFFLKQLDSVLNKIFKVSMDIILCGNFNINHLDDSPRKHLLESF